MNVRTEVLARLAVRRMSSELKMKIPKAKADKLVAECVDKVGAETDCRIEHVDYLEMLIDIFFAGAREERRMGLKI